MYEENKLKQYPEFPPGSVPTLIAAKVIGMDKDIFRREMKNGELKDLGIVRTSAKRRGKRRYTHFYISPMKLYERTGYIWKGERTIEELNKRFGV